MCDDALGLQLQLLPLKPDSRHLMPAAVTVTDVYFLKSICSQVTIQPHYRLYRVTYKLFTHSAVLRFHVVRQSVCLTLVDQDRIGWKSWKLIARSISPTPSLFVAKKPSTYSQGNMGKFGGDSRRKGGVRKSGVLEQKSGNNL